MSDQTPGFRWTIVTAEKLENATIMKIHGRQWHILHVKQTADRIKVRAKPEYSQIVKEFSFERTTFVATRLYDHHAFCAHGTISEPSS